MPQFGRETFTKVRFRGGSGSYILLPVLTTTQRDALTCVKGLLIYNSTTGQAEETDGSTWRSVGQAILTTHTADLDAHMRDMLQDLYVGGYFLGVPTQDRTATAIPANILFAHPLIVARDMTIDRIGLNVAVGESGKVARLGIYKDNGSCYPGTLIKDYGTVDLTTAAWVEITISPGESLVKGLYWIVLISNRTSATFTACALAWSPLGQTAGASPDWVRWNLIQTYGALPTPTFTAGATFTTWRSAGWVRIESLD